MTTSARVSKALAAAGLLRGAGASTESAARFADGGAYKWEVAGAFDGPSVRGLADRLRAHGVRLHQVTNTVGVMRYLDDEIRDLVEACRDEGIQLRMSAGPRGVFDIGGQRLASSGVAAASAYRLRGLGQLADALEDTLHAVDLGVTGFLVFDEGLLWTLHALQQSGDIPTLRLKASSNMGAQNPAHVVALAQMGADSVNLQRDLDVEMLAQVRAVTDLPLDLHTDNPAQTGGFVRGYDVPRMVRAAAPVYLKTGNAAQDFADTAPSERELDLIARQLLLDHQMLTRWAPELTASDEPEF
ncbi:U32 family peptidase [Demequina sp. NBRC 110054]|uniref:U32 family peptidase n=1 Tax=Demequina sp. NBRC 110054 TaxID=1570343 RepID=UPI000A036ADE|nr:U32 family peptidase [Demequina sp. NBRC 110054]